MATKMNNIYQYEHSTWWIGLTWAESKPRSLQNVAIPPDLPYVQLRRADQANQEHPFKGFNEEAPAIAAINNVIREAKENSLTSKEFITFFRVIYGQNP